MCNRVRRVVYVLVPPPRAMLCVFVSLVCCVVGCLCAWIVVRVREFASKSSTYPKEKVTLFVVRVVNRVFSWL